MSIKVLIPSGALGLGYDKTALDRGLDKKPDLIAIDGGSTDSGPAYLGKGISKYSRASIRLEWKNLMEARQKICVPLIIGTAGTCGTDETVDWFLEITKEIAEELGYSLKVAIIKCSQKKETVALSFAKGKIKALPNAPKLTKKTILNCTNIVALAGAEQIIHALNEKPDIIIAGRTTDTAIIAALPILKGVDPGLAWHGAKIGECGALCTTNPTSGVILIEFYDSYFTVEPMSKKAKATAKTVSAHMLYENSDPFQLLEPGGHLDVTNASYQELGKRKVKVTGAKWVKCDKYKVKLEGTILAGFQFISLVLIRDEGYVERSELWVSELSKISKSFIEEKLSITAESYNIEFRLIGKNATLGSLETGDKQPNEIGVISIITAESSHLAGEIARTLNPLLLHHPLSENEELPTFAFPFSPAEIEKGPIYSFCLNHVMELDCPMRAFSLEIKNYG